MSTTHIGLRLSEELVKQIDEKRKKGHWMSRSEYIRHLIHEDVFA